MNIANKLLRKFTQESSLDKNIYDFNLNTINKSVVIGISSTGKTASEKTHKYPIINPVVFVGKSEKIRMDKLMDSIITNSRSSFMIMESGDIFQKNKQLLESKSVKIKRLDFSDTLKKNHYNPFRYVRDYAEARKLAKILVLNGTTDEYFPEEFKKGYELIYGSCIYYVLENYDDGNKNLKGLKCLLMDLKDNNFKMDAFYETLPHNTSEFINYNDVRNFKLFPELIEQSLFILEKLFTPEMFTITETDDLELEKINYEQTALFINAENEENKPAVLISMLYSQAMDMPSNIPENINEREEIVISILMNDFSKIGRMPKLNNRLSKFENIKPGVFIAAYFRDEEEMRKYMGDSWERNTVTSFR